MPRPSASSTGSRSTRPGGKVSAAGSAEPATPHRALARLPAGEENGRRSGGVAGSEGPQGDDRDAERVGEEHAAGLQGGASGYVPARFELALHEHGGVP